MHKWTAGIPILGAYALSAAVYPRLTPPVRPDFSPLLPFTAAGTETLPRAAAALMIPTVALALWVLLALAVRVRGPVKGIPEWWLNEKVGATSISRFQPTYETVLFSVTALLALMHVVLIGASLGWPRVMFQVATALLGAGFIAVGNVMPRVRPNWIVGLRTRRTLSDPSAWAMTHRLLGAMMIVAGGFAIICSIVLPRFALLVSIIALLSAFVLSHIFGTRGSDPSRQSMGSSNYFSG